MADITPEVINALNMLREAAAHSDEISNRLARAFCKLDNAGVFAEIDEATGYRLADTSLPPKTDG